MLTGEIDWVKVLMVALWSCVIWVLCVYPIVAKVIRYFKTGCWNHHFQSDPNGVRRVRCSKCNAVVDDWGL